MRIPTRRESGTLGFNMTPMIDIVFLLIIFFIVSSHLARQENQVELALPSAESGTQSDSQSRRVTVHVLPDGSLILGSLRVTPAELPTRIAYERDQKGQDLEVRIRSDRHVPYRIVAPILVACTKVGVWKVTFAVVPPGG